MSSVPTPGRAALPRPTRAASPIMVRVRDQPPAYPDLDALVRRARGLAADGGRALLGIAGAPGSGKSTLALWLARALGELAVVVPMDGFHLTDDELDRLGLRQRKGAPETFDVWGYLALLRRLRQEADRTVFAPAFDRLREASVAGAIPVRPGHRIVITEGNYLLHEAEGWREVRPLLDDVWFLEADEQARLTRLVQRHVDHGKDRVAAERWVQSSDQPNAELVAGTRSRADLVVRVG